MLTKWKFLSGSSLHTSLLQLLFFLSFLSLLLPLPLSTLSASSPINYRFIWPEGVTTLEQKIHASCAKFGCDGNWAVRVMNCESKGKNIRSANGLYFGIYQFTRGTWADFSSRAGIPGANIWSVDAQGYLFGWAAGQGLSSHWPTCKYS